MPRRTRPPGDLAQTGVVALLLAVAAMTWALTHPRMAGINAGPNSDLAGPGWFALGQPASELPPSSRPAI